MNRSEMINELATALSKAQGQMSGAKKDSENPHFRSKYADLASVREACWKPLTDNGLSVLQSPRLTVVNGAFVAEVETTLMHTSGQFITDTIGVPLTKADAQGLGSAVTYARRYALSAFAGIAPEDDDGNAAVTQTATKPAFGDALPKGYAEWLTDLDAVALEGPDALKAAWKESRADFRKLLAERDKDKIDVLKAKAAQNAPVSA